MLGYVLLILSSVLDVFIWERIYDPSHDLRDISWLSALSGIIGFIGIVLMVASIVFVIRGLRVDNDRQRSGTILIGTLRSLEWVAIIALTLYLLYLPISLLGYVLESVFLLVFYASGPAFLCLWALPLIVAHALNKPRA
ncbi:MAG: hypothetical protein A3K60_04535 [Euryarchaeota archaeon RBG_19FT_COMBO_56_21]|nr:MAG: hypothetical protein A3K60_04535 [Euryarchaeota archaeon RBG_19FT_COMBO_56_21]